VRHVGQQVGVGGRLLLEQLSKEELVGAGLRRRRERRGGHGMKPELGTTVREIEEGGSKRAKESDPQHFSSPFINNAYSFVTSLLIPLVGGCVYYFYSSVRDEWPFMGIMASWPTGRCPLGFLGASYGATTK
jgi:hypothetical protein